MTPDWPRYATALPSIAAAVGRTPLVRLNRITADVRPAIYVKVEWYGATGSLKDRIYLHMYERAEARGDLRRGMSVLECSTGNAGIACAWVAAVKGYACTIVMPEGMSDERKKIMRAYGASLVFTAGGESDVDLALARLEEIRAADPDRYWVPGQFDNADNIEAHTLTTGPEVWEQMGGRIGAFVDAQGSGGHADRRRPLSPLARRQGARLRRRARRVRAPRPPRVGPPRHRGHRGWVRPAQPGRLTAHRRDHHHHGREHRRRPPPGLPGRHLLRHLERLQRRRRAEARPPPPRSRVDRHRDQRHRAALLHHARCAARRRRSTSPSASTRWTTYTRRELDRYQAGWEVLTYTPRLRVDADRTFSVARDGKDLQGADVSRKRRVIAVGLSLSAPLRRLYKTTRPCFSNLGGDGPTLLDGDYIIPTIGCSHRGPTWRHSRVQVPARREPRVHQAHRRPSW